MNHEIMFGVPLFRYHLDPSEIKRDAEEKFKASQGFPIDETPGGWDCSLKSDFNNSLANVYTKHYDGKLTRCTPSAKTTGNRFKDSNRFCPLPP